MSDLKERAATQIAVIHGKHGYIDDQGSLLSSKIVDVLYDPISKAIAVAKAERPKVCLFRRDLMKTAFGDVVGPEGWADTDDPVLAEEVYKLLDRLVWSQTNPGPTGPIQTRLSLNGGNVLCRTKVNPHGSDAVYVTRDLACINEDILKPQAATQKTRADRDAALTAMLIERIPKHSKRFGSATINGLKTALNQATATIESAITVALLDEEVDE